MPETHLARAALWAALLAAALGFPVAPPAPGPLALVRDTDGCHLDSAASGLAACACQAAPLALREALGLRAPLNALSAAELERIPGLGSVRAAAVASERAAGGPYAALDDLARRVPGIGPRTVDRIRPRLFVEGPDPACGGGE